MGCCKKVVIAYEPMCAIGTGKVAFAEQTQDAQAVAVEDRDQVYYAVQEVS